jgi:hypothetical protein
MPIERHSIRDDSADTDAYTGPDPQADTEADSDSGSDAEADPETHAEADAETDSQANAETQGSRDQDADPHCEAGCLRKACPARRRGIVAVRSGVRSLDRPIPEPDRDIRWGCGRADRRVGWG